MYLPGAIAMNFEAHVIRFRLMRQQIGEARLKILSSPSYNDATASMKQKTEMDALLARVEKWRIELRIVANQLKSSNNLLEMRRSAGGPRMDYSQRQSIASKMGNNAKLLAEIEKIAEDVGALLDDLVRRDAAYSAFAKQIQKILESMKSDGKAIETSEMVLQQDFDAAIRDISPGGPLGQAGPVPLASFLVLIAAIYAMLKQRR